ncbi:MAG: hypothetical protein J1F35_08220 [Erysipelotrichales bacterium]|nr:hypothetical protein [Erysipelotrichales bacterium]
MAKKYSFDIEINNSEETRGSYLMTTKPMTFKQVEDKMVKMGKDLLRNNKHLTRISYDAWEADSENPQYTWAIVSKTGRKFFVLTNSIVEKSKNK